MPGLSFNNNQGQSRRPGGWIVSTVLIVLSVLLITLYVRSDGTGAFAGLRAGVQTVSKPMESALSAISGPFRGIGSADSAAANMSEDEASSLKAENEQLHTLVAELEEYRQQDQRLTSLLSLRDAYNLSTLPVAVLGITSGWDQTATIDKGSDEGVQVGQGVMSSCGLFGQVETVQAHTATVRLVTDAQSSVSARVQSSRATGILRGSYDGTLVLEYVPIDTAVGAGDVIVTSGDGGAFPGGIILGRVRTVEQDSSKLYYRLTVAPIYDVASCQEGLVLTGNEDETANLVSDDVINAIAGTASASAESNPVIGVRIQEEQQKREEAEAKAAELENQVRELKSELAAERSSNAASSSSSGSGSSSGSSGSSSTSGTSNTTSASSASASDASASDAADMSTTDAAGGADAGTEGTAAGQETGGGVETAGGE